MHKHKLVHGDIMGGNVLVDNNGHIKICDFGLSKYATMITSSSMRGKGNSRWKAPELITGTSSKTTASDVYAIGMTICEVKSNGISVNMCSNLTKPFVVFIGEGSLCLLWRQREAHRRRDCERG